MAESIIEQTLASIKTELESIRSDSGATYWYTPSKVPRVDYFDSRLYFKPEYGDYLYMIRDTGDEDYQPAMASMAGMASEMDVFIMLAAQDTRNDKNPFTTKTYSGTIRNRMVKDVRKKLESDVTRGGLTLDTSRWSVRRDFEEPPGWIIAEVHFVVTYEYTRGSP